MFYFLREVNVTTLMGNSRFMNLLKITKFVSTRTGLFPGWLPNRDYLNTAYVPV